MHACPCVGVGLPGEPGTDGAPGEKGDVGEPGADGKPLMWSIYLFVHTG